ncbi:nucleotidyltransferase [Companilactobacillus nuruki]|uniref:tRNA(Met) cytidine acetate ligase n=1 Tax=Companilactobacillus nuruki TaxID=1993540 RepID=A0A2N7AX24_9LACO|nr:nucleotidyltransferase [Companilactobacillus nuruki]PMD73398.1 hypothetical protein CBP76_01070 [Companilactobacillus nuruki]
MTGIYGFVAEFNPFHNGHKLFIDTIKQKYHPDVLIAVMSSNFVQRGDFAILDKWDRTVAAIDSGVDLVIELPVGYAVEPADLFAKGAIKLLDLLKIDHLVFGTENQIDFSKMSQRILQIDTDFEQDYQKNSATNLTDFYRSKGIDIAKLPNQMLGLNYAMQIEKQQVGIEISTIERHESQFSATEIRKRLVTKESIEELVPVTIEKMLHQSSTVSWSDYFVYLKYQIINSSTTELQQIYQMVEGLENKLQKEISTSDSFNQFMEQIKSKRYTMARLRRLMVYTLLNVKKTEIDNLYNNPYLRVLGFDTIGQKYLKSLKKEDLNLITRVGKKEKKILDLEIRADRIRQLVTDQEEDFGRIPYMKGVN